VLLRTPLTLAIVAAVALATFVLLSAYTFYVYPG
jgi:hypothetical protein